MLADKVEDLLENQTATNSQLKELTSQVQKIETKIEHDLGYKIKALFDARETQNEKNNALIKTLDRIETKIEMLQMETAHIRKVK